MAVYKIVENAAVKWSGEAINGVQHPPNIEAVWTAAELAKIGLHPAAEPEPLPPGHRVIGEKVIVVDGVVKREWLTESIPPITAAERRAERTKKLAETDFYFLTDGPTPPTGMGTYRQELRDLTLQAGFPTDIIWPDKPLP